MRDDDCILLMKNFIRWPPGVGRGMLACGGVAVDLSEFVFRDLLILVIYDYDMSHLLIKKKNRKTAN
jgi:hypothetical protein